MLRGLREGQLDMALMIELEPKQLRGVAFEKLRPYPVCVAVGNSHRLRRSKTVCLNQVKNERLVVYSRSDYPEYHTGLKSLFSTANLPFPEIAEEHDSGTSLIAAVEAGRVVAIVP